MKVLVTGSAGFIGAHVCRALVNAGHCVRGLDNFCDYYDPRLKGARVDSLCPMVEHRIADAEDAAEVGLLFDQFQPEAVIHLAAQAGVRYSLENPGAYAQANLVGFTNILEACRRHEVKRLLYASSSSVYGDKSVAPFTEDQPVNAPLSFYAATKAANELMAASYTHLFGMNCTALRFFTVYGPWGRPDMSLFRFVDAIVHGRPVELYNEGRSTRDFTYVDDIVAGVLGLLDKPNGHEVYNIGSGRPIGLHAYVDEIAQALGVKAQINYLPMQPGDVEATHASIEKLNRITGFSPKMSIEVGIRRFVNWYLDYHKVAQAA